MLAIITIISLVIIIEISVLIQDSLTYDLNHYRVFPISQAEYRNHYRKMEARDLTFDREAAVKLALVSDFHARFNFLSLPELIGVLVSSEVDIICIAGDLFSDGRLQAKGLKFLHGLAAALEASSRPERPILIVRGNHDRCLNTECLGATQLILLQNQSYNFRDRYGRIWSFSGIEDPSLAAAKPAWSIKQIHPASPVSDFAERERRVLLGHNPDLLYNPEVSEFSYALFGHLHDGQIAMPFRLEFKLRDDNLPTEGIYGGFCFQDDLLAYISSGLGSSFLPFRWRRRAELAFIDIYDEAPR